MRTKCPLHAVRYGTRLDFRDSSTRRTTRPPVHEGLRRLHCRAGQDGPRLHRGADGVTLVPSFVTMEPLLQPPSSLLLNTVNRSVFDLVGAMSRVDLLVEFSVERM